MLVPMLVFILVLGIGRAGAGSLPASLSNGTPGPITYTVYFPVIMRDYPLIRGPVGVQMYGAINDSTGLREVRELHSGWIRVPLYWKNVEPSDTSPEYYNWASYDQSILNMYQSHIEPLINIDGTPRWASSVPEDGPIDEEYLPDFAEFIWALVERYDGDGIEDAPGSPVVRYWEFYNEPDHIYHWGYYGEQYAHMLSYIYPVVKSADPEARVVFGGVFNELRGYSTAPHFLDTVLDIVAG